MKPLAVHAFNPGPMTGTGNWTWLIHGRVPTLIDAGTGHPLHLEELERALEGERLAQVLVTHGHGDHASGATALFERYPDARFMKMPWPERDSRWPVEWQPIEDGSRIPAGDDTLVAVHTPGHAPDHLCFWHEESRTLFGGDLAVKGTTVYIPPNLQGDLIEYLASLERVIGLQPARLLPAHGAVIDEPEAVLRDYIEHRHEREEQILEVLRHGDTTPDAMVARIYRGLRNTLLPMARESVLAHLIKLEKEGRAGRGAASAPGASASAPRATADRSAPKEEAWHIIEP